MCSVLTAGFEEGKPYHGAELPNKWAEQSACPSMTLEAGFTSNTASIQSYFGSFE
jgi:hypothetical protein